MGLTCLAWSKCALQWLLLGREVRESVGGPAEGGLIRVIPGLVIRGIEKPTLLARGREGGSERKVCFAAIAFHNQAEMVGNYTANSTGKRYLSSVDSLCKCWAVNVEWNTSSWSWVYGQTH